MRLKVFRPRSLATDPEQAFAKLPARKGVHVAKKREFSTRKEKRYPVDPRQKYVPAGILGLWVVRYFPDLRFWPKRHRVYIFLGIAPLIQQMQHLKTRNNSCSGTVRQVGASTKTRSSI